MPEKQCESVRNENATTALSSRHLPLVPFERFLRKYDSPTTPMVFRVAMRLNGPLKRQLLTEAFQVAIRRQPLLTSRVIVKDEHAVWELNPVLPELQWQENELSQSEIERTPIDWIDLSKAPGLVARIWEIDNGLTILLDIHHACSDGQGARHFIGEWLGLYQQLLEGKSLQLAKMQPDQLLDRGMIRNPTPPIGLGEGLRNLYVTIRGRTIRLPERKGTESLDGRSDHLIERPLSALETASLRQRARAKKYTVNDAAVAASFLAFAKSFPDVLHPRRYLTVLHPVDLRWPSDLRSPACNRVGVSFLRRRVRDLTNPAELLDWVHSEMQYIKRRYVGAEFLRGLALAENKSGIVDLLQRWGYFIPTLQFTGLGNATRAMHYQFPTSDGTLDFGGLKLDRVSGIMQMGPFMPLSLTSCETNRRITLTLRASARYLTADQAERFLDTFVEQIVSVVPE